MPLKLRVMSLSIHIIFLWRLHFQDKIHVSIWLGLLKHLKLQIWGWIILYLLRFYLNVFSPLFWPICSSEEFWFAWFILISYTIQPSVTENMKRLVCFSLIKSITILYTLFQNGHHFSILLFSCKEALVASFLNSKFQRIFSLNKATRATLQVNKRILKWWPFWNKVVKTP